MPDAPCTRRRLLALAAFAATALASGCGGAAPEPTAESAATPAPTDILAAASKRLAETPTVGFALAIEGDTFVDRGGNIRLLSATGDLQRPDRVRTEFKASVLNRAITLQLVTIGEETWLTDIVNGNWGPAPAEFAYRPDVLFDTQSGLGPVMGRVTDVVRQPDEEFDGRPAYRLTAVVPGDVIGPLTYGTMTGTPVTVDLWIDRETSDLLRARLAEPPQPDKEHPATWTLDLVRHGEEVSIEPPV